jgi:hypothetical protein
MPFRSRVAIESIIFGNAMRTPAKCPFSLIFLLYTPHLLSHPFAT